MNLIGKTVKIEDDYKYLLAFFYPSFILRDKLFFNEENNVIYYGPPRLNLKDYLAKNTKSFISLTCENSSYDVDFTNRFGLLEFVYEKWGRDFEKILTQEAQEYLSKMPSDDFYNYIKTYWIFGSSELDKWEKVDVASLLSLTEVTLYDKVISLLNQYNEKYIEACFFNYINSHLRAFDAQKLGLHLTKYRTLNMCRKNKILLFIPKLKDSLVAERTDKNFNR